MKLDFSRQILEKSSNIKVHKNRPVGRTDGQTGRQTDRPDEANSRYSQFCESAQEDSPYCCL